MRSLRYLGLAALAVLLSSCFWPAPGYGPDRRSFNPAERSLTVDNVATLRRAFVVDAGDRVSAPIVGADGVFVAGIDRPGGSRTQVRSFDPATGATRWTVSGPELSSIQPLLSDPYLTGDHELTLGFGHPDLYVQPTWDQEARVDTRTGAATVVAATDHVTAVRGGTTLREGGTWVPELGSLRPMFVPLVDVEGRSLRGIPPGSHPTLGRELLWTVDQSVFASDLDARCPAVETRQACPTVWETPLDGTATPVVVGEDNRTIFVGTSAGTVYALDGDTGAVVWTTPVGHGSIDQSPALARGVLYFGTGDGTTVAVDSADGSVQWSGTPPAGAQPATTQPVVAGDVVYVGSRDAVDAFALDGSHRWHARLLNWAEGMAVAGGHLYVTSETRLYGFAPG
jgi:outer membrane protein assembly factor BamB